MVGQRLIARVGEARISSICSTPDRTIRFLAAVLLALGGSVKWRTHGYAPRIGTVPIAVTSLHRLHAFPPAAAAAAALPNGEQVRFVTRKGSGSIVRDAHIQDFNLHGTPGLVCIHSDPPVFLVGDFLTAAQCDELRERLDASEGQVAGTKTLTGGPGLRTSTTRYLDYADCPEFVGGIERLLGLDSHATFEEVFALRHF